MEYSQEYSHPTNLSSYQQPIQEVSKEHRETSKETQASLTMIMSVDYDLTLK